MPSVHAFAEKVALISGGSSPVGRAVSLQLALLGAFVVTVDDEGVGGDRAIGELTSLGTLAASIEADVSTSDGAESAVGAVDDMFGRIDLLVNCLKAPIESPFLSIDAADIERSTRDAVGSPLLLIQKSFRLMNERPKARIVNVFAGSAGSSDAVLHGTFRAAVAGMTEMLANELPRHFRINTVAVDGDSGFVSDGLTVRPAGISNDDVARTVLFLLSGESVGINGRTIPVGIS